MVSGALPFEADTPLARAVKRTKESPTPLRAYVPGLDSKWEAAILRCLERDPAARFPTAAAVAEALSRINIRTRNRRTGRKAGRLGAPAEVPKVAPRPDEL